MSKKDEKEGREVAAQEKGGAVAQYDYGDDEGSGFEQHTKDDYKLPFLAVLQGLSPQVVDGMPGATPGKIFNTVTNAVYDGKAGIGFVPCFTHHCFGEWMPREKGGGLVAIHETSSSVVKLAREKAEEDGAAFGKLKTDADNDLIETFYVYGIAVHPNGEEQAVVAFTSTKIKKYKGWMTMARNVVIVKPDKRKVNPPLFAHRYRLTTAKESNNKGEFFNFEVAFDGADASEARLAPDDPLYFAAKGCKQLVASGVAKADFSTQNSAAGKGGASEEEIPY